MAARTKLTVTPELLAEAAAGLDIDATIVPKLWSGLDAIAPRQNFNMPNVAFYFGALTVISAMTWFMTNAWNDTGGFFKLGTALIYAVVFAACGMWLRSREMRVPSGLLFTAAVCMTPLAMYGAESATHFWVDGDPGGYTGFFPWIRGSWILMELATIAAGLATIRFVRFPFLVAPIGFASWFASMDLAALAYGKSWALAWDERANVSMAVGLITIVAAFLIDRFTREDYALWLYLFGSLSFWGGLWGRAESAGEPAQFATFVIGLAFIAASPVLGRRVLTVFGGLGCFGYVGHLAWNFRDSLSFPVALTIVGLSVIALGFWFQSNLPTIENAVEAMLPETIRKLVPRSRIV